MLAPTDHPPKRSVVNPISDITTRLPLPTTELLHPATTTAPRTPARQEQRRAATLLPVGNLLSLGTGHREYPSAAGYHGSSSSSAAEKASAVSGHRSSAHHTSSSSSSAAAHSSAASGPHRHPSSGSATGHHHPPGGSRGYAYMARPERAIKAKDYRGNHTFVVAGKPPRSHSRHHFQRREKVRIYQTNRCGGIRRRHLRSRPQSRPQGSHQEGSQSIRRPDRC